MCVCTLCGLVRMCVRACFSASVCVLFPPFFFVLTCVVLTCEGFCALLLLLLQKNVSKSSKSGGKSGPKGQGVRRVSSFTEKSAFFFLFFLVLTFGNLGLRVRVSVAYALSQRKVRLHATIYVSAYCSCYSYYYIRVLILLYMCPQTAIRMRPHICIRMLEYVCVRILLVYRIARERESYAAYVRPHSCPHTAGIPHSASE